MPIRRRRVAWTSCSPVHDGLAQRPKGGLDGPKSKIFAYMRHARYGESDRVLVRLDSSVQLRGTEFKVASRTPETVGGEQPLVAGTPTASVS